MKEKKNVIITGVSGFVGSNLQDYLKPLFEVIPLSVRYRPNQQLEIKADAIVHLAGKAHDLKKGSKPTDYYEANFELTKQLFDTFLLSKASVFVFISTVKSVADTVEGILKEDAVANPQTHYGISKQQAEQYILSQKLPNEKRVYILRPCMIHGAGNKGNLNLLYQLVSKGLPWPLGDFENQRSFLSIENLCFVIKELLQNTAVPPGVYQVADDEALSTNELIQLLGISLGKKTKIWKFSAPFIRFFASIGDKIHLPLNSERLQKLTENYVVSNTKIVAAMGRSLPITAKRGLLETFQSFRTLP